MTESPLFRKELKALDKEFQAKYRPIQAAYRAKREAINKEYDRRIKPIEAEYWKRRLLLEKKHGIKSRLASAPSGKQQGQTDET